MQPGHREEESGNKMLRSVSLFLLIVQRHVVEIHISIS